MTFHTCVWYEGWLYSKEVHANINGLKSELEGGGDIL